MTLHINELVPSSNLKFLPEHSTTAQQVYNFKIPPTQKMYHYDSDTKKFGIYVISATTGRIEKFTALYVANRSMITNVRFISVITLSSGKLSMVLRDNSGGMYKFAENNDIFQTIENTTYKNKGTSY